MSKSDQFMSFSCNFVSFWYAKTRCVFETSCGDILDIPTKIVKWHLKNRLSFDQKHAILCYFLHAKIEACFEDF